MSNLCWFICPPPPAQVYIAQEYLGADAVRKAIQLLREEIPEAHGPELLLRSVTNDIFTTEIAELLWQQQVKYILRHLPVDQQEYLPGF